MKLSSTRFGVALATAAVAITASVAVVTSPAYAAEEDPGIGTHCVETQPDGAVRCFSTYDEAKAYVSSFAETLPPKRQADPGVRSGAQGAGTQVYWPVLLFVGFDWEYYLPFGGTYWVVGLNGPCTGPISNIDYQLSFVGSSWNDDISSYVDYSNCWTRLYQHINFGGSFRGYQGDSPTLGHFNNITSSIRWS
jgi:hypothetical protein